VRDTLELVTETVGPPVMMKASMQSDDYRAATEVPRNEGHPRREGECDVVQGSETSDMLILFYSRASASDASKKIDEIRTAYDKTFRQESVLREDGQLSCVSF
jgi:hypothetical protein